MTAIISDILEGCIVTGAWQVFPSDDAQIQLSPPVLEELEAFLSAGPPPVYVSFAGMVVVSPKMMRSLSFAAFAQA